MYTRTDLERALAGLVDCFDTGGDNYTIEVLVDGESVIGEVDALTTEALETAMHVLYDEAEEAEEAYT